MKNSKAPGEDASVAELIKNGGMSLKNRSYRLICAIWRTEGMPKDWCVGLIFTVFLKKGDKFVKILEE
jgi:hypothetical protein